MKDDLAIEGSQTLKFHKKQMMERCYKNLAIKEKRKVVTFIIKLS